MRDMSRVQAIWESVEFQDQLAVLTEAERDRVFCAHGLGHLLDVARIAWIMNLERGLGFDCEVVYSAALLHDVGRAAQYATGEPHDVAGERIAAAILDGLPQGARFSPEEREQILGAVRGHRGEGRRSDGGARTVAPELRNGGELQSGDGSCSRAQHGLAGCAPRDVLAELIREADHRSRPCYACMARTECYWSDERKNLQIRV